LPIAIARFALVLEPWEAITPEGTLGRFLFLSTMKAMVAARAGASGLAALGQVAEGDDRLLLARDAEGVPYMFHCVDVRDIVQGLRLLLDHQSAVGEVFNLSGPAPFSYAEVIPYLSQKIDRAFVEANIPGPPIRIHHSTAKARALVGYQPQCDVFRTIDDAVAARTQRR
jgi:nucleoside-diphosphate-sugar epimerase